jgi:oligoendopeptidase F
MSNKLKRSYVAETLTIRSFEDIKPYYEELLERPLPSDQHVNQWLLDWSELDSIVSEDGAWRYIKMNCNTADEQAAESFNKFVGEIEPEISLISNQLNHRFNQAEVQMHLDKAQMFTIIREVKKDIELFRQENVPIEAQMQQTEQEYGVICSKMTVEVEGKQQTLQQAANYFKNINRELRQSVYLKINQRRIQDASELDQLMDKLLAFRNQIARNAGYPDYRDFRFRQLSRFDYTVNDCLNFHQSIARIVVPVIEEMHQNRKKALGLDILKPYDLDVDISLKEPLKAFETVDELTQKTIFCFRDIDPELGIYLNQMRKMGHLDLDSRIGKAPGGFNYPLHESNVPFIFMNATGNLRDIVTLMHEGGHAVHAFLCASLPLVGFKETPPEIAELASMSMELITMDYWHYFFKNEDDLKRAKRIHLEDVLSVLPWIATIDKFQHFLYTNPNHSEAERTKAWLNILDEFGSSVIDYSGYEIFREKQWQKQLHLYEVPFYYIEYGIAQLGAISIWKRFKEEPAKALADFKAALKMGYTSPIPDVYKRAGIKFSFDADYIQALMDFVRNELKKLE